jgi:uncharacterized Rossmann fold enzyme
MLNELKIGVESYGVGDEVPNNIRHSLSLGLEELAIAPCAHDGTFVIVGSSPSVVDHLEMIRSDKAAGRSICAINGGHDFLMERGITPDLFLTTDPRPMPQNFKHINDTTVYLMASRCSPESFETLKDKHVILWHAWAEGLENDEYKGRMAIGGGSTSGLRAINVGYILGYRKFHLYGMDSCLAENKAKRWDSGPLHDETKTIDVHVGGREFLCNMAMAQQAQEFQSVYDIMGDIHIECFGDGLISAIIEERKKQGLHT